MNELWVTQGYTEIMRQCDNVKNVFLKIVGFTDFLPKNYRFLSGLLPNLYRMITDEFSVM